MMMMTGFERGVKEAIYIRALNPSLNRDGGRYNLPPVSGNIKKKVKACLGEWVGCSSSWSRTTLTTAPCVRSELTKFTVVTKSFCELYFLYAEYISWKDCMKSTHSLPLVCSYCKTDNNVSDIVSNKNDECMITHVYIATLRWYHTVTERQHCEALYLHNILHWYALSKRVM